MNNNIIEMKKRIDQEFSKEIENIKEKISNRLETYLDSIYENYKLVGVFFINEKNTKYVNEIDSIRAEFYINNNCLNSDFLNMLNEIGSYCISEVRNTETYNRSYRVSVYFDIYKLKI